VRRRGRAGRARRRAEQRRQLVEAPLERLEVAPGRQVERVQHALERALHHAVELGRREGDPVAAPRALAAQQLAHVALQLVEAFGGRAHAALERVVERVAAALDQVAQHGAGHAPARALGVDQDLRKRHRGDVLAALVVDHADGLAGLDQLGDALERDVATRCRVVELAVRVALDEDGVGVGSGTVHGGDLARAGAAS